MNVRIDRGSWLGMMGIAAFTSGTLRAQSVFDTGANSLVDWGLTIATPFAVIAVLIAGGAALVGKISWGWVVGGLIGIGVMFGAEQIVAWVRGLFGV